MDIYEYAMKMERDGENYYRELAGKISNKGLKNILNMLADEEVRHYNIIREMKENEDTGMIETDVLKDAKSIFARMRDEKDVTYIDKSEIVLYTKALELEKKSEDFYLMKADGVEKQSRKTIFLKLAEEEKRHYRILENIIDFVSRPLQWLEDAEWYHLDEY